MFFYSHSKEPKKKIGENFYPSGDEEEKVKHSQKLTQVTVCSSRVKSKILANAISLLIAQVLG